LPYFCLLRQIRLLNFLRYYYSRNIKKVIFIEAIYHCSLDLQICVTKPNKMIQADRSDEGPPQQSNGNHQSRYQHKKACLIREDKTRMRQVMNKADFVNYASL